MNAKTDKNEEEKAKEDILKASTPPVEPKKTDKPTGKEHWGEGGSFKIDKNGRRVRKPEKE